MGIIEFLEKSSCEEIEAFCSQRFKENLNFFQVNYPNLFAVLQEPFKEYQLYIGKEGLNIINTFNNPLMFPLDKSVLILLDLAITST